MVTVYLLFYSLSVITVMCNGAAPKCLNDLSKWIKNNGGTISDKIEINSEPLTQNGVYNKSPLKSHEILAKIPISTLFTLENAENLLNNILPQNRKELITSLGPIDTLALALLIEYQNEDSFWKSYLKCLPTINEMKNDIKLPLFWTENEIQTYLQSSKVGYFMIRRLNSIKDSFKEISNFIADISYMDDIIDFTMDYWVWALSIVWSRSFNVMIQRKQMKCLVPFGDFFNFNNKLNDIKIDPMNWNQSKYANDLMNYDVKSFTDKNEEYFIFEMKDDFKSINMQLFAEYSIEVLPNFVVFLDYGFCIADNPMDGIWVTIEDLLKNNPKFAQKFNTGKIRKKSQEMMKKLIEKLQLGQVFVSRSIVSAYYIDSTDISFDQQAQYIEPYGYSLFLMSLILNSKNNIMMFGKDLLKFKENFPKIKTNQEILITIIKIIDSKFIETKRIQKLIKNTWNTLNDYFKSEMNKFDTTLIQDLMFRDILNGSNKKIDIKLECGLAIRIDDKFVLFSVWNQLRRLRKLLLSALPT